MNNLTSADLFSGAGGVAQGMKQAGFTHAWGLEFDPAIAEIYRANHGQVYVQNILDADPMKFEKVDLLHASPVCKSYSRAKTNAKETQLDLDCAAKVCEFIYTLQPQYFTLENVAEYGKIRNKKGRLTAFGNILYTLRNQGYSYQFRALTASHYGVPQSRKRLILIAEKGRKIPQFPEQSESIGWYQAIADLIPNCQQSEFAGWQKNMTMGITKPFVMSSTEQRSNTVRYSNQPIFTIKASDRNPRALLESGETIQLGLDCLARLQSFPKDYIWEGKIEPIRKGIGNAVPPLLYEKVIRSVANANA
jgi:site-specific DNA-cytosine methylase